MPTSPIKKSDKYAHDMGASSLYEVKDPLGFNELDIAEYAAAFRLSDIIGDGKITYEEVPRVLGRVGEFPAEATLQKLMNHQIDPDGVGVYSFQDFLRIMKSFHQEPATEEVLLEAFKIFDSDKSGTIEAGEIKHCLSCLGDKMTEAEAEEMVAMADKNCDGSIGYNEFINTILGTDLE